jgi:hypothetical protein
MSVWKNYHEGLRLMLWSLNALQNDKNGFYPSYDLERKSVSPASITALKNGVEHYSLSNPAFSYFKDTVFADYLSQTTSPETFQKPIYFELKALLEKELGRS